MLIYNAQRKGYKTVYFSLGLGALSETDPESKIQEQIVYLGDDPRKCQHWNEKIRGQKEPMNGKLTSKLPVQATGA